MRKRDIRSAVLALALAAPSAFAALTPLPQGAGLAAAYPGDAGITANANVLFNENFEGFQGASVSWANGLGGWGNAYGNLAISRDTAKVHSGSQCVEVNHTSGLGTHGADKEFSGNDTLFVRFYMKFAASFPGVHHAGMGIRGGPAGELMTNHTGTRPSGTDFFQAYLDHLNPRFGWDPVENSILPGWIDNYCYHMDQTSNYGDVFIGTGDLNNNWRFSTDFVSRPNVTPARNRWNCYEIMVQANTIGSSNGRVAIWLDGVLVADHPGLRFRTIAGIKARYVALSTYSSEYVAGQTLWYDDIVVAKSYIGPMTGSTRIDPIRTGNSIRNGGKVTAACLDFNGRLVSRQMVGWDGKKTLSSVNPRLPSGLYLIRVTGGVTALTLRKPTMR